MNICIITYDYPDEKRSGFAFVKQLVNEFANQGMVCSVIAPYSITKNKRFTKCKKIELSDQGKQITVYRPNYLSFSNFSIGSFSISAYTNKRAVNKVLTRLKIKPELIYCHFWSMALSCYDYAINNSIPLFVASGESTINKRAINAKHQRLYDYVSGVVCVSNKNKKESILYGLTIDSKCKVFPNAINSKCFRLLEKEKCREELNLPSEVFIIAFVGWFDNRKGSKRLSNAIDSINDNSIYSIFIGIGEEIPTCRNILFKGQVPHNKIPTYLNAADVFVLPTLHEGCCNAIVEAMACGLPIISSDLDFNKDILNENNSIMIDPMNEDAIATAILKLKNNDNLRFHLSKGALETAKTLSIDKRAKSIIEFMQDKINTNN